MPRPATGSIETHEHADGRTVSYYLRVRAYGHRHRLTLGTNHQGWNQDRATVELDRVQQQIARGTWQPPVRETATGPEPDVETVHVTLSRWWNRHHGQWSPNTRADYEWRAQHILRVLKDDLTSQLDAHRIDELRDQLVARDLSPRSVNMALSLLAQVLDDAVDYGLLPANPARGRRRRMKVPKSSRAFLEPDMVIDLLDAAGAWEAEVQPHQRYGRRALLALLCLAGPRISEAVAADRREFDLANGAWLIPEAKTDAGQRTIDLTAYLGDELRGHAAARKPKPSGPMFPSRTGRALNDHNLRSRLLPEVVRRANEARAARGALPLPARVTPHTLRRTFASLCFFAGRDPRFVMSQIGHEDARLTLAVYAQCMERRRVDSDLVWHLMRFGDEPEHAPQRRSVARASAHHDIVTGDPR